MPCLYYIVSGCARTHLEKKCNPWCLCESTSSISWFIMKSGGFAGPLIFRDISLRGLKGNKPFFDPLINFHKI